MLTTHNAVEALLKLGVDGSTLCDGYLAAPPRTVTCDDWVALMPCIHQAICCNLEKVGTTTSSDAETTDFSKRVKSLQALASWIKDFCTPRGIMHVRIPRYKPCDPCCIPDCWVDLL